MRKDIFIDNNVAKNFANPLDPEYKKLIQWLMAYDLDKHGKDGDAAYLMVSNKLIAEYQRTSGDARSATNITMIISQMTKEGRLVRVSNQEIAAFKRKHFKKRVIKKFTCNEEDRELIPVVLLSDRKYALSLDNNFIHDLENFPGFVVVTARRPENLLYDK